MYERRLHFGPEQLEDPAWGNGIPDKFLQEEFVEQRHKFQFFGILLEQQLFQQQSIQFVQLRG